MKVHYIDGKWIEGKGDPFYSKDPMTNEISWEGKQATDQEVDRAVKGAKEAQVAWRELSLEERITFLKHFQSQLEKQKKELALCISKETGKPLWESHTEVSAMIQKIPISIEAHKKRAPNSPPLKHKPHGVLAIIAPFNFPGHLPNGHIIPALLAGNTVVLKSSEHTPTVSLEMIHCWERAKIPAGVIQLLQGEEATGQHLVTHPQVDGVCFTGSLKVGQWIHSQFANHLEKVLALELGGNNPLVVSKVEDKQAAALTTIQSAYLTAGQRCSCARRLIVVGKNQSFIDTLIEMIETIQVGPFTATPEPFMGPVIDLEAQKQLLAKQKKLEKLGGKKILEMKPIKEGTPLLSPGLIDMTGVTNVPDEEIFGPLLQLITVNSLEEAIKCANETQYGLTAALLSSREKEFNHFFQKIEAGVINWNKPTTGASSALPFGGIKKSGNSRPAGYYSVDYCTHPVVSMEEANPTLPKQLPQGISWTT
ncbi:MAG: N-succinylglutamate 5-semialdehyde dehydrogenase [Chlamydiales bacterium]|nr:N-succinylglutamate 5-semialdehyde dehydrogenase [Chlamydiales bacterium]MCH9620394.1 N-succinylglutamate 5-semialdehyde dehydrogenase [Chlamydiales bacterium]MCH9622960.1 N-succinylglutamate 5-semialdehyde dehydrogenase [Chlamydiales bacterium]